MAPQEAINNLKKYENCLAFTSEEIESIKLAIEALEKQIAKTPTLEGDGYWDGELVLDTWFCPNCDKNYEVDYDDYDYCPNCGQKIDWSE